MSDGWIADAVADGGYAAVGGLTVLENLVPPIPSEVVLPLAGFAVAEGTLHFGLVFAVATLGSVLGALILYAIGRGGGRPLLERRLRVSPAALDRADAWFARRGPWVVGGGRLVPGVRSLVSIPAGAARMPVGRFLALTTAGAGLWNLVLIGLGAALAESWRDVEPVIGLAGKITVAALIVGLGGYVVWRRRQHRRQVSA